MDFDQHILASGTKDAATALAFIEVMSDAYSKAIRSPNSHVLRGSLLLGEKYDRHVAMPRVAISRTIHHSPLRSESFTCSAPANSNNPSMPSNKDFEKLNLVTANRTVCANPNAGNIMSIAKTTSEANRATTKIPIALGSFKTDN